MNRLLLILLSAFPIFAGVTVIEQSPGVIRLRLTADTIRTDLSGDSLNIAGLLDITACDNQGNGVPAFKISLFADDPENASFDISVKRTAAVQISKPLKSGTEAAVKLNGLNSSAHTYKMRDIPLRAWFVTPVLSVQNGVLEQFTEAEAVIRYTSPKHRELPRSELEKAFAAEALNPGEFCREPKSFSRESASQHYIGLNDRAVHFTLAGKPGLESETDGSIDNLIKITPEMLKNAGLGENMSISEIAVFGSNPLVQDSVTPADIPSALIKIPTIMRDLNSNAIFDTADELLFFAGGANFWEYQGQWSFRFNCYSEKREFYITRGSSNPISKFSSLPSGEIALSKGLQLQDVRRGERITHKKNLDELDHSSRDWVWKGFEAGNEQFVSPPFPVSFAETGGQLKFLIPQENTGYKVVKQVKFGSGDYVSFSKGSSYTVPAGAGRLEIMFSGMEKTSKVLDYCDFQGYQLRWDRSLNMSGLKKLRFYSSAYSPYSSASYTISNVPAEFTALFRIHSGRLTIELIDSSSAGAPFSWNDSLGQGYEYAALSVNGAVMPALSPVSFAGTPAQYQIRDLHAVTNQTDYMIAAPAKFLSQAVRLAQHKAATGQFKSPTVVTIEDIYREFSGGVSQPAAIRNFMAYVHRFWQNSSSLDYLILLGNGHYDFKQILPDSPENFIFPYIDGAQKAVEDFYAYTSAGDRAGDYNNSVFTIGAALPDLSVGRVPANSEAELNAFLDKLILMEGSAGDYSEWRNRVLLVSDDDLQGGIEPSENIDHVGSSDDVGRVILDSTKTVNVQKINLFEYSRIGQEKPAAKAALLSLMNKDFGVGIINYFGHGSPTIMADERILLLEDLEKLNNYRKYLIFCAFSCSVGFFDIPKQLCLAGRLITLPEKGGIASIGSTRVSYADENTLLAKKFFANFFSKDSASTIGTAYTAAKVTANITSYALFGDPSYRPMARNSEISLNLQAENGTVSDTMIALQTVYIKGKFPAGSSIDSVRIHIQNPEQKNVKRKDGFIPNGKNRNWSYSLPGKILLNRAFAVSGDSISQKITIPLPVLLDSVGTQLRLYGWSLTKPNTVTAVKQNLYFNGIDTTKLDKNDKVGPVITARLAYSESKADTSLPGAVGNRIVIDGFPKSDTDITPRPVAVDFFFSDSSGIDIFGDAPGEGLTMSVKGVIPAQSLNGIYRDVEESSNKGSASYFFREDQFPAPGEYEMTVTASDYMKNVTKTTFILDIKSLKEGIYDIGELYAYPSPVHLGEQTRFYFNAPTTGVSKMVLKIFTLSGQLVRQFDNVRPGVSWDLTDQVGNRLSPNVYLYRLYVERNKRPDSGLITSSAEKEQIRSGIRKMAVYPPR